MNLNKILIQCIFNNTRRRLFEAKSEEEARKILDDMTNEISRLDGPIAVQEDTKGKLIQGLETGIQNSKTVYEILDHLEYALLEAEDSAKSQSTIRYKA